MFWEDLFGPFVEHGISMEEVRRMDLHDVKTVHGYWRRNPPLRVLVATVAIALGIPPENVVPSMKPKEMRRSDYDLTPGPQHMTEQEFKRLMQLTGGKIQGLGQFNG